MPSGKKESAKALKHHFGKGLLTRLSDALKMVYPAFDPKAFLNLHPALTALEMKPRVQLIRDELRRQLPSDYRQALAILLQSITTGKLSGFDLWPYTEFVGVYGIRHLQASLTALKTITPLFTSEWAIRPFLRHHQTATLEYLKRCATDPNVHVRRWASEGSRPRLPWGERLTAFIEFPELTLPILEILKFDPELFVRKSVSNHLNDIAKDHPDLVVKLLTEWKQAAGSEHGAKLDWITRRGLRSLIKKGHAPALKLIGVSTKTEIRFFDFKIHQKQIRMGEHIDFEFCLQSTAKRPQNLVIDYVVHFVKSNQKHSPKVFKLKTFQLSAGETLKIAKAHDFKEISTRVYYPGVHKLEIQINGAIIALKSWKLAA